MKKILNIALMVAFIGFLTGKANGQVVMQEFLSINHKGQVDKSLSCNGSPLYYQFEYVKTDRARILYTLHLYKDKGMSKPWMSFNVVMRNPNGNFYVDITMPKDGVNKDAAMIFRKDLRWSRVKFSPHEGCARVNPPVWERYTIGAETETPEVLFAGLLNNFIMQLDKNVDFSCYATK